MEDISTARLESESKKMYVIYLRYFLIKNDDAVQI